jgi:hypothetical protein
VREAVHISRPKDKTPAKLKRILPQFVLLMTSVMGAFAGFPVIAAQEMEQIAGLQLHGMVRPAQFINQKRKRNASLLAKLSRINGITEADRRKNRALLANRWFVLAQLRDVLAAKDSAVVPQEHQNGWLLVPQGSQPDVPSVAVRQRDQLKSAAESIFHASMLSRARSNVKHRSLCRPLAAQSSITHRPPRSPQLHR